MKLDGPAIEDALRVSHPFHPFPPLVREIGNEQ